MGYDAGHSHGPTPYFVTGCPMCDAAKAVRNQVIARLHEAVHLLSLLGQDGRPTIRLNLGPIGITGDDVEHCHSVDLSAKQGEALADAIDSLNAYAGSQAEDGIVIDEEQMARSTAQFMGFLQGQSSEAIESGEWSAAAVAQNDPDLFADVTDVFMLVDPVSLLEDVFASDKPRAAAMAYEQLIEGGTGDWDGGE